MRSFDAIIMGAGIIGLALARSLRKAGLGVLVTDKGEPARESSYAGAGMLVSNASEQTPPLRDLAAASDAMYPSFVRELEEESGLTIDFRREGTIVFADAPGAYPEPSLTPDEILRLEPAVSTPTAGWLIKEDSVDPRTLNLALISACRKLGVHVIGGSPALEVLLEGSRVTGVRTRQTDHKAGMVVNAAGAWGSQIRKAEVPVRPVKGHMLALMPRSKELIRHVLRSRATDVYMLPRTNGPVVVGATVEDVGFDKAVVPETILRLHQAAALLVPELGEARIHESWTGLRPCSPDGLPLIGETSTTGVYVANGHFRNGILLAPLTAKILTAVICGQPQPLDITAFSPMRFTNRHA